MTSDVTHLNGAGSRPPARYQPLPHPTAAYSCCRLLSYFLLMTTTFSGGDVMSVRFSYGTVRESNRRPIFVVRVEDALLELVELEDVAERMREKLARRGSVAA